MIPCPHFAICSGCQLQKKVTLPPLYREVINYFSTSFFPLYHGEILGWRTRAKLAVRGSASNPEIGLFKRGTHEVVSIPGCLVHHPRVNQTVHLVKEAMKAHRIEPYQEESGRGLIRYIQVAIHRKTAQPQLTLVVNAESLPPNLLPFLHALSQEREWHSLWINFQPARTNQILSDRWLLYEGEEGFWETLAGIDICFHPACFAQAHLNLFEKILLSIQKMVIPQKRVVEFYAGIGVIGLSLAAQSLHVTCSESNPFAKRCFENTHKRLTDPWKDNIRFEIGKAETLIPLLSQAEVIVVDPPRKGLEASFLDSLNSEQLIYLSCGWDSFKRDCDRLLSKGWLLDQAEGYLLFPGSDQIEILASFRDCR